MKKLRSFVATSLAVFAALWIFGHCTACLTDQMKKDVAFDVYEAQQQACIDQYADRKSIDKCRDRVKKAWATDAGADAGRTLAFANDNGHPEAGPPMTVEWSPEAGIRFVPLTIADAGKDAAQ